MKALTLWQPWATLIAVGAKRYETRSWATDYRGPLVIHAAKRPPKLQEINPWIVDALLAHGYESIDHLPLGAALCVVDLVDVVPADLVAKQLQAARADELLFGNYAPGRFAWKLENVRRFPEPVPARGRQGLWDWEGET